MPGRRRPAGDLDQQFASVERRLLEVRARLESSALRSSVGRLVDLRVEIERLGVSVVRALGIDASSARGRILAYLQRFVGEVVSRSELDVVAGISDYPRRIRELRTEYGFQIISGASPDPDYGTELQPDEYVLLDAEPDEDSARRWALANAIRKEETSASARLLAYFLRNVGRVVTTEELAYVAREKRAFARRVRELRTESGYAIATRFTGRPDLGMGQYVMESPEPGPYARARALTARVERAVFERDSHRCRVCGWSHVDWTRSDPRHLALHHVKPHLEGGVETEDNLIVVCKSCHEDLHAGRKHLPPDFHADVPATE